MQLRATHCIQKFGVLCVCGGGVDLHQLTDFQGQKPHCQLKSNDVLHGNVILTYHCGSHSHE